MNNESIKILGVRIDPLTTKETLNVISSFLESGKQYFVVTPNPEIILHAQTDNDYRQILNEADLNLADGVGLLWAAQLGKRNYELRIMNKGKGNFFKRVLIFYYAVVGFLAILFYPNYNKKILPERVSGTDVMRQICFEFSSKVFLLGAAPGIAEKTGQILKNDGAKVQFIGFYAGSVKETDKIIEFVNQAKPEILFVAFGAPAQEKWIYENLKKMPSLKVAMGVGGAFDFLAGKVKRAPLLFQKLGLEWLWRLIIQPWRIKRIYRAVIKFPVIIIRAMI